MSDCKLENVESPRLATYDPEECKQKSTLNADDSISRQKAIERLTDIRICLDDESQQFMDLLIREISDLPSAEPEIIRCKDCEHWDTTWQNDWAKNYHYCPLVDGTRNGDWYCADAERRTDDEC